MPGGWDLPRALFGAHSGSSSLTQCCWMEIIEHGWKKSCWVWKTHLALTGPIQSFSPRKYHTHTLSLSLTHSPHTHTHTNTHSLSHALSTHTHTHTHIHIHSLSFSVTLHPSPPVPGCTTHTLTLILALAVSLFLPLLCGEILLGQTQAQLPRVRLCSPQPWRWSE